jgi:uncharacterized protein (DUF952 family)
MSPPFDAETSVGISTFKEVCPAPLCLLHDRLMLQLPMTSPRRIYKILPASLWRTAQEEGVFRGAPVDLADGYIHFSTREQVAETAAKHFAAQSDLVLLEIDAAVFGDALKWEPSRGGALFPHLYGDLELSAVRSAKLLPWDGERHIFPELT